MTRQVRRRAAAATGLLLAAATACTSSGGSAVEPTQVAYVVSPHPDDEFQAWSLVEDSPDTYTVFIMLTQGEETRFCEPDTYAAEGYDEPHEPPAEPEPRGRWTESCSTARLASWVAYTEDMAATDPSLPGDLGESTTAGPFPASGTTICRDDRDTKHCGAEQRTAQVWLDSQDRGALVSFDLGDGDLSADEVVWALETVRDHREDLGLDTELPESGIIGAAFANRDHPDCFVYDHPDHHAVHEALADHDFGTGPQSAATCRTDPRADRFETVTASAGETAFAVDGKERVGAHTTAYGWLHEEFYPLDRTGQNELFHSHQAFWTRY